MIHTPEAPFTGAARLVLAIALAGSYSFAQSSDVIAEEVELAPVTVSAHDGTAVPCDRTGASVCILDIPQLKEEGIYTLTEALTTVPGVFALPGGGDNQKGNVSSISIRGMRAGKYTLPMIDGMRLGNSSGNGNITPNIAATTSLHSIGQAEVLKGAQGAVYGAGAMAGVIYMQTPEGQGEPSWTLFTEAGSYDTYTGSATAQGRTGSTAYFVNATYEHSSNDITFADGSKPALRHAGRYEQWSEAVRVDHYFTENDVLTLTYRRADSEYRYPGTGYYSDYEFQSNLVTAKYRSKISEDFSTELMAGYFGYDNKLGEGYYPQTRNVQIEWRNLYRWDEEHSTTFGLSWTRCAYGVDSGGQTLKNADYDLENTYSIFAEHTWEPSEEWVNSFAARLDQSTNFDALLTLRAATSYKFNEGQTRLYGSVGRGYSSPSSFQRSNVVYENPYGWYGPEYYVGNPDLDCEQNWSVDFGIEHRFSEALMLSATAFWSRIENGIVTDYARVPGMISYSNDGSHWTTQGVELAASGQLESDWNTRYKLSWTYAQPKRPDGSQMPGTARQVWNAEICTTPLEGFTTGFGLSAAIGRSNYDGYAPSRLDNFYTLRWFAQYKVNDNLTLHLRVENLTNQKFVTEPGWGNPGFSMINSGISIFGGATITF